MYGGNPTMDFNNLFGADSSGTTAANPPTPAGTGMGQMAAMSGGTAQRLFGMEIGTLLAVAAIAAALVYWY